MLATLVVLGLFRPAFYRADSVSVFRLNGTWIVTTLALLAAVIWIGIFAHSHLPYRNALWWDFTWHGDASRFLRASLVAAVILAVIAFNSLMTGKASRKQLEPAPDAVRRLVTTSEDS